MADAHHHHHHQQPESRIGAELDAPPPEGFAEMSLASARDLGSIALSASNGDADEVGIGTPEELANLVFIRTPVPPAGYISPVGTHSVFRAKGA